MKIMKKAHFTDSQILTTLKQTEGSVPIPELCRENQPFINDALNSAVWLRLQ